VGGVRDVYRDRGFGGRQGVGEHPALVVIDLNYGFTDPESPLHCDADSAVEATARLLEAARAGGCPVAFTTIAYDEAGKRVARAFIAKAPALAALTPGSRWAQIDARIAPRDDEPVLLKLFASAFFGTALQPMLTAAGCDTLVVAGASTSGCVRATVVDALQHGLAVIVPREAVADRAKSAHEASLTDIDAKYGDVVGLDDALALLCAGAG
jgi:maleamate amidohydrolase